MAAFIVKRLLQAVFVVLAVTLIVSFAIRLSGDPAIMLTGAGSITEKDLENIRTGARPRTGRSSCNTRSSCAGILVGDFGRSFMGGTPVSLLIAKALPSTLPPGLRVSRRLHRDLGPARDPCRGPAGPVAGPGHPRPVPRRPVISQFLAGDHDGAAVLDHARPLAAERHGGTRELRHAGAHHGDHPDRHERAPGAHRHAGDPLAALHHGGPLQRA